MKNTRSKENFDYSKFMEQEVKQSPPRKKFGDITNV